MVFEAAREAVAGLPFGERAYLPEIRAWWLCHNALLSLCSRWPMLAEELAKVSEGTRPPGEDAADWVHQKITPPAEVAEAFAAIHLAPTAPVGLIAAARRWHAREHHPDRRADASDKAEATRVMQRLNAAADIAEKWAEEHSVHA